VFYASVTSGLTQWWLVSLNSLDPAPSSPSCFPVGHMRGSKQIIYNVYNSDVMSDSNMDQDQYIHSPYILQIGKANVYVQSMNGL